MLHQRNCFLKFLGGGKLICIPCLPVMLFLLSAEWLIINFFGTTDESGSASDLCISKLHLSSEMRE